jgi:hypothetical protein
MRHRKVRGHRRRWKIIHNWLAYSKRLDLDYLDEYACDYVKIRVRPWGNLSLRNSAYSPPKGKTKQLILSALIDVYEEWEKTLEAIGQPYYLKIWLYDQRFEMSQVVCALGDRLDFYTKTFEAASPHDKQAFPNYGRLNSKLNEFVWKPHLDEDHTDTSDVGDQEDYESAEEYRKALNEFNQQLRKPHRVHKLEKPYDDVSELYFFKRGLVWTGEKEKNITQHLP